jgi:hypothetical protein
MLKIMPIGPIYNAIFLLVFQLIVSGIVLESGKNIIRNRFSVIKRKLNQISRNGSVYKYRLFTLLPEKEAKQLENHYFG